MGIRSAIAFGCAVVVSFGSAQAAQKKLSPDMKAADIFITKAFGNQCERHPTDGYEMEPDADQRFDIKFKYSYDTADTPDNVFHLYKMFCSMGAYNVMSVFLTRDEDGNFQALSFAQPTANYDYVDDTDTKLKHPPVVTGIGSTLQLVNAEYNPDTKSIVAVGKWRGIGDAYDEGTYEFKEGVFQLTKYVVDPIFEANIEGKDGEALASENYTLFELPKP